MSRTLFYGLLVLGIGARIVMLVRYGLVNGGEVDVYLADEGVVGLMAMHILEGRELPVFFYGQNYLGALEAYLAAVSFGLFGAGLASLRLVPFLGSLILLALVYRFTYRAYSMEAARWATALVAVAPVYFLQWNLKARGGFVEHVVLLVLVMILFWRFYLENHRTTGLAIGLGFAAGVALWVNQLMLAYLIVFVGLLALGSNRRALAPVAAGLLVGASLLIGYNVVHPLATARSLGRKAIVLNRVPVEERDESWLLRGVGKRVDAIRDGADKLGLVFGVPPREGVERLGLTEAEREGAMLTDLRRRLWILPLMVFGIALVSCRPRRGSGGWSPFGSDQLLALLLAVTFVVGYVSPRYMLPAYPLAAVMVGVLVTRLAAGRRRVLIAGIVAAMAFNLLGWVDAATRGEDGDDGRGRLLLALLDEHGLTRCYSAGPLYHLVFASNEEVVIAPLQKDRYPPYNAELERAASICYVFRDDQQGKRQHVAMMDLLEEREVTYSTFESPPYRVLYELEPRAAVTDEAIDGVRRNKRARALPEGRGGTG